MENCFCDTKEDINNIVNVDVINEDSLVCDKHAHGYLGHPILLSHFLDNARLKVVATTLVDKVEGGAKYNTYPDLSSTASRIPFEMFVHGETCKI